MAGDRRHGQPHVIVLRRMIPLINVETEIYCALSFSRTLRFFMGSRIGYRLLCLALANASCFEG